MIHELALLVDFHGMCVDDITSIEFDPPLAPFKTCVRSLGGFLDFERLSVRLVNKEGNSVIVCADRCGSENATSLHLFNNNQEVFNACSPLLEELPKEITSNAKYAGSLDYLLTQWEDYITVKEQVAQWALSGKEGSPTGLATLNTAVEALKLAEVITKKGLEQGQQKKTISNI